MVIRETLSIKSVQRDQFSAPRGEGQPAPWNRWATDGKLITYN
jgi:hypothetical protein